MHYRRISADCHLDLPWLPPDLFVSEAPRALKDRMPHVVDSAEGPVWVTKNGPGFGLVNGVGPLGRPYVPGKQERVDRMAETGLYEDGRKGIRRISDPHLRAKEMDRDGVDAEVIYGILAAASRLNDHEAANEALRIYNDWMKEFCSHYPERHIGLACLPYGDIDAAVKEVYRVAKLGMRGLEMSCSYDMPPMSQPMWEPLWKAVDEVDLPIHFHAFPSRTHAMAESDADPKARRALAFTGTSIFQMTVANIITALIGAGVFDRYPNVRVAFGESGIGWIPYLLHRMDFEYDDQYRDLNLKLKPSEYWRRHCRASFQLDPVGLKLVEELGEETLMWGSDYPHPDGLWPDSSTYIDRQFAHLPAEMTRKITCDNAAKFYRLVN